MKWKRNLRKKKNQITSPRSESNLHNLHRSRFFHSHFILSSSNFLPKSYHIIHPSRFLHFKIPSLLSNELQVIEASLPEVPFCIFKLYNTAKKTTTKWMQIPKSIAAKDTEETDKTSTTKCTITGPGMDIKNWRTHHFQAVAELKF